MEYVTEQLLVPFAEMEESGSGDCQMAKESCGSLIGLWSVGHMGTCEDEAYGFRLGKNGFRRVMLQVFTLPS